MNRRGILGIIGSIPFVSFAAASEKKPKKLDGPIFRSFKPFNENKTQFENMLFMKPKAMTVDEYYADCINRSKFTVGQLESRGHWLDAKVNYEYGLVSFRWSYEKEPNIITSDFAGCWYEEVEEENVSLYVPPKWTRIG